MTAINKEQIRKIALDKDDSIVHFIAPASRFMNKRFGTGVRVSDFRDYEMYKALGITPEESDQALYEFYDSHHFTQMRPHKNAFEVLSGLANKGIELVVVTSRPATTDPKTREFLDTHYQGLISVVRYAYHPHFEEQSKTKAEICLEEGIDLIIEDSLEHANNCARAGIPALLLPRSWNEGRSIEKGVTRVRSWSHIGRLLL